MLLSKAPIISFNLGKTVIMRKTRKILSIRKTAK